MGNEQGTPRAHNAGRRHLQHGQLPSNARLMGTAVKQRLSKGNSKSTYNMKVVIRGDRQTGKSALFHRLEGGGFIKEHRVTAQLQTSHVLWPYKTSDEMVNLEIWDVVDKAIVPTNLADDTLSVTPSIISKNLMPADATTIDVYKGAHAVIFMVDPTRKWTFDYVKEHIGSIPNGIDCVILFNKKDVAKHWTLTEQEISEFMTLQDSNVRALQISLQDCYGMKELHSFFNVPFLRMKAKYLQHELARAQREHEQSKVELDIFIKHQNYDEFLNRLRALKEHKNNRKLKSPPPHSHSVSPDSPVTAPALPVKQTVRSSKDLPLIQQLQQQKQQQQIESAEAMKKEMEFKQKTKELEDDQKAQEDILEFRPTGGLNEDFFADVGEEHAVDSKEDEESEEEGQLSEEEQDSHNEVEGNGDAVRESNGHHHGRISRLKKPMMITADTVTIEDSDDSDEEEEEEEEPLVINTLNAKKSNISNASNPSNNPSNHSSNHPPKETIPVMNGHHPPEPQPEPEPESQSQPPQSQPSSKMKMESKSEPNASIDELSNGFAAMNQKEEASEHTLSNGHSSTMNTVEVGKKEDIESESDHSESEVNAGSGRKLQSLMKLQPADVNVEESDSDEFDDEPLVFATAPKEVKTEEEPESIKQKLRPKAKVIGSKKTLHRPKDIEVEIQNENEDSDDQNTRNGTHLKENVDPGREEAFDSFLKDLGQSTPSQSKVSPTSVHSPSPESVENGEDGNESEEDGAARRRRREEKKARKEERRRRKEAKRRRKKEKKRKKKKKKENDLQEFSDSDEIVEIE